MMFRKLLIAASILGALASPAAAARVTTTVLYIPTNGSLGCYVTNVSNHNLEVTVKMVALNGTTLLESPRILAPGASSGTSDGSAGNYTARCEFEFPGSKSLVRAASVLYPGPTSTISIALPAE